DRGQRSEVSGQKSEGSAATPGHRSRFVVRASPSRPFVRIPPPIRVEKEPTARGRIAARDRRDRKRHSGKKICGRKMFLPPMFLPSPSASIRGHSFSFRIPFALKKPSPQRPQRDTEVQSTSQAESPQEIAGNADDKTGRP
ncbi:MAG: hypothetical protein ACK55I_01905, partial [bacterium]